MNKGMQLIAGILLVATIVFFSTGCSGKVYYPEKIMNYCKRAETFKFSDVLDFEWNIAYIDRETYGIGTEIKEKYDLECEVTQMATDGQHRLIFFQDDKFVKAFTYAWWEIDIEIDGDIIKPDTVFNVSWEHHDYRNELNLTHVA